MKTNNVTGRNLALVIGVYLIIKTILNMIIGNDPFGNVVYSVFEAVALFTGLQYINYVIAGILLLVALLNLPNNISNIEGNWVYLLEGVIDIFCAGLLIAQKDIKEHFTNKWTEIGKH